ncbi:hypothetical protein EJB05_50232, partial [Eragrostis curvula]
MFRYFSFLAVRVGDSCLFLLMCEESNRFLLQWSMMKMRPIIVLAQPRKAMRKVLASKQVAAHNDDDDDFVAPKWRPVAEDGGDAQERPRVQKRRAVAEDGGDAQERPRVQKRRPVAKDGGDPQESSRAPLQGHGGTGRPQFMDMGLTDDLRKRIEDMGFKGLVNLAPTSLDSRDFLCWLMDIFNPKTMTLDIGGGKQLPVTKHAMSCVTGLPNTGKDPPDASNSNAKSARTAVGTRLFPETDGEKPPTHDKYNSIHIATVLKKYHQDKEGNIDDDLCLRLFFMVANLTILTPNTDSYIRIADAWWCEDLETIRNIDWVKVVVDNLWDAGRKWKASKIDKPSVHGCIYYLDSLSAGELNKLDPLVTPRCTLYTNDLIKSLEHADARRDGCGRTRYGNLPLKSIIGTCYEELPPPPPPAPVPAPAPPPVSLVPASVPPQAPLQADNASSIHHGHVFPSFEATCGCLIADLVSHDKRTAFDLVLKKFDDDTTRASEIISNAHNEANEVMRNARIEAFSGIRQLLEEARIEKANVLRKESAISGGMSSGVATNDGARDGSGPRPLGDGDNNQDFHEASTPPRDSVPMDNNPNASVPPEDTTSLGAAHVDQGRHVEEHCAPRVLYQDVRSVDDICNMVQDFDHNVDQYFSNECSDVNLAANPTNVVAVQFLRNTYKRRKTTLTHDVNKKADPAAEQKKIEEVAAAAVQKENEKVAAAAVQKENEKAAAAQKDNEEAAAAAAQKENEKAARALERNRTHTSEQNNTRNLDQAESIETSVHTEDYSSWDDEEFTNDEDSYLELTPAVTLSEELASQVSQSSVSFKKAMFTMLGDRLCKVPKDFQLKSPFECKGQRPIVQLGKALALMRNIAKDPDLQNQRLIHYGFMVQLDGQKITEIFHDGQCLGTSLFDYLWHLNMDNNYKDKEPEPEYARRVLEDDLQNYDITKAKLIWIPIFHEKHWVLYCINIPQKRIDILDSNDWKSKGINQDKWHEPLKAKIPLMYEVFCKATDWNKMKMPDFSRYKAPYRSCVKQQKEDDSAIFSWKNLELWQGDSYAGPVDGSKGYTYRAEMLHYIIFHAMNEQQELPEKLDKFRIGGRRPPPAASS